MPPTYEVEELYPEEITIDHRESAARMRQRLENDFATRRLTREVLAAADGRDPVDAYYDVALALAVLKKRMDEALGH